MSRRRVIEKAAREERASAIRRCRRCDPCGWLLGPDRTPIDPAVRCTHRTPTSPAVRDITVPIHEPDLYYQPPHSPTDPED
ncbi:hypothetical protein SAMN04489835_4231 [Mycolicibacterium rutilum]|uniref:Uncharacterized protein n=1 Tax=Mycolicibacterium rutilum TaxID=370526 RepID=A0A1H6KV24_MYCRU|nr:hypothetical protein [Mycolicibacterium rutilum]SEH79581.1 hypothetical protein SAMN04489835_4231 [Mycolicibacterium rutilum]